MKVEDVTHMLDRHMHSPSHILSQYSLLFTLLSDEIMKICPSEADFNILPIEKSVL